jgi:subtilisin family serine protease
VSKRSVKKIGLSLIAFLLLFSTAFSNASYAAVDNKEKASKILTEKAKKRQNDTKVNKKEGSIKDRVNANQSKVKNATSTKVKKSKIEKKQTTNTTTNKTQTDAKKVATTTQKQQMKKSDFLKEQRKTAKTDEIIVKFKPNVSATAVKDKLSLKTVKKLNSIGAEVVKVPVGKKADTIISALKADSTVLYAQPNYKYYPSSLPNDTLYSNLWGLHNTGQFDMTPDMDIDLPEALEHFNASTNQEELVIAVIDTGIDINHPELQDIIWQNPKEIAGNNIDDDHNGYVDDVNGWDFYHLDNSVFDVNDLDEHGTHVAGTIAAVSNNNIGVAGIAPNVKIMPLKFLGPDGGSTSDAILAVEYAARMGVKVTNNSWGGGSYDQALYEAIMNSNSLFVAAAGNDSLDIDIDSHYPSSYDLENLVSVAAITGWGELAGFSNYGNHSVDIAAPGEFIESTVPKKAEFGAAAEITNGTSKTIVNGFGFEKIADQTKKKDAFKKALNFLGATTTSNILLVQDDQAEIGFTNYLSEYTTLLDTLGYPYTTHTVLTDVDGPSADVLKAHDIVIWFSGDALGYYLPTLTSGDLGALTSYIDAGGKLLLSGQDILWRNTSTPFVLDTLGLNVVGEQERADVTGVTGTIYDGLNFPIDGAYYADLLFSNNTSKTKVNFIYPKDLNYDTAYSFFNGTSMATPHVTGVAALLYGLKPELSPVEAKNILMASGDSLDSLSGKVASGKTLNAYNALTFDPTTLDNDVPGVELSSDVINGSLDQVNDTDDVFAVKLNQGETIKATLTGDASTDFDLYLFDPYSTTVQDSTGMIDHSENTNTSSEGFSFTAYYPGTYYIDVYAFAGSGNYTLNVTIGNGPGEYENDSKSLTYYGYWPHISNPAHSGGYAQTTNYTGSKVSFSFIGDEIQWIGYKDTNQGFADIYIDGKFITSVSQYSSTFTAQQSLLNKKVPYGKHILEIVWTGKRDPLARKTGTSINVDKLIVRENLVPPTAPTNVKVAYDTYEVAPKVQWGLSTDPSATGYKVYRKASTEAAFTLLNSTPVTVAKFLDRTAKAGSTYDYYVTAVGIKSLESVASNTASYLFDDNAPGVLMNGTSATGSLTIGEDDLDVWAVQLEAGKTYSFSFNGSTGTDFDYFLFDANTTNIYGEGVSPLRVVEEIGSEEFFTYPVTQSGKYYLVPVVFEGAGSYIITVANKPTVADDNIPGVALTTNQASDFLDPYDIDDVYSVELGKGDTITVNLSSPATNYNDFDLYLYGPNATNVITDTPVAYSVAEDISTETVTYVADVAGKYFTDVNWFNGSGPYTLSIDIKNPTNPSGEIVTKVESDDPQVIFSGNWGNASSSNYSGNTLKYSKETGASAEYNFKGTGIKLISMTGSNYGLVDVYIDGVYFNQINLNSSTSVYQKIVLDVKNLTFGDHSIKLVNNGVKLNGTTGSWINIDAFEIITPAPSINKIEESDSTIKYNGTWGSASSTNYSGNSLKYSREAGASVEYNFKGSGISLISMTGSNYGLVDIYIDGVYFNQKNLNSSTSLYQKTVLDVKNLTFGDHTIKIVNKGEKLNGTTGSWINIDALEINTVAPSIKKIEEYDPSFKYHGNWTTATSTNYSGGTLKYTKEAAASLEYTFTGNGIKWSVMNSKNYGIAELYIDGVLIQSVNLYAPSSNYQTNVFEKLDLSYGQHTIKIVNKGLKGAADGGIWINIDSLEIYF